MKTDFLATLKLQSHHPGVSSGQLWRENKDHNTVTSFSPVNDQKIATITCASKGDYEYIIKTAQKAFLNRAKNNSLASMGKYSELINNES